MKQNISKFVQSSIYRVQNTSGVTGGTAYVFYVETVAGGGFLYSSNNVCRVTGFTNNYFIYCGTGNTVHSHLDTIHANSGSVGSGEIYTVNSSEEEYFEVSGLITATGGIKVRTVTDDGMNNTLGIQGEIVFNTFDSKFYGCTTDGSLSAWAALS